jgi:cob(I)alamin adenosyltransferase
MTQNNFIPRKFKNIETNEIVDFEAVIKSSDISVILGEPASGKTFQLKNYKENNENSEIFLLKLLSKYEDIKNNDIILLDSIDEALLKNKDDDELILDLTTFINKYKKKKFIITCRYLEWKEDFEEKLKTIDKELKVYDIQELSRDDINLLLNNNEINEFWNFIETNHLELLLKNIMIVKHLTTNFKKEYQKKDISYIDIYQKIVEQSIKSKGKNRKHEEDKRKIKELFPIGASLATYMTLNIEDNILNEKNIEDIENFVDELYQIDNRDIKDNDLKKILDTALFEKKGEEFNFFHKSIQEYLTAYFINYKKLNTKIIKKIFAHDLRFYEKFEEVIIYLTNIQPTLFDDFVDFDPFIFRRHPSLTAKQQENLLLSVIDKLRNSESYAWDRVNFFYNTSLVKFDKIDVYSLIKNKNHTSSGILLQYIMRVFAENYSKEFEDYIFNILSINSENKVYCSKLISYSYNLEYEYNLSLFSFMKKHQLFFIEEKNSMSPIVIGKDRNLNSYTLKKMFLLFCGFKFDSNNHIKIIKRDDKDYDVKRILDLLHFIEYEYFVEITSSLIKIKDIEILFKSIPKTYKFEKRDSYQDNVGLILHKILMLNNLEKKLLKEIIFFMSKSNISVNPPELQKYKLLSFDTISNNFWAIYFSDSIQDFSEVKNFLDIFYLEESDIKKIQKKYSFENNFMKTIPLLEYLKNRPLAKLGNNMPNEELLVLDEKQLEKIISKLESTENREKNELLIELLIKLYLYNSHSQKLKNLLTSLLKDFFNMKKEYSIEEYIKKYKQNKENKDKESTKRWIEEYKEKNNNRNSNTHFKFYTKLERDKNKVLKYFYNQKSWTHFESYCREDINKALEYFYKNIYDPIPIKIVYSTQPSLTLSRNMNHLFNSYLNQETFKIFYKNKSYYYNPVKIILFERLLNWILYWNDFYKKSNDINDIYIKRILIDYFVFFKEEKVPVAKNNIIIYSLISREPIAFIIKIWELLQNDIKYKHLLKELEQLENKNISDSATYCLLKISEKKEKKKLTNDDLNENVTGAVVNHRELNQNINTQKDKITFNYKELLDNLILIAKQILKNLNSIEFEKENAINDKFISGLELQKYNVAGENRVNNANERDIIIKDENQSEKAIVEALRITSIQKDYIKEHYDKLIGRYDVMGHSVGYLLIYVKNQNFEERWKGYKAYLSEFSTFEDTNISDVSNIKVGKNQIDDKIIYHIFINFYNKNENKGIK